MLLSSLCHLLSFLMFSVPSLSPSLRPSLHPSSLIVHTKAALQPEEDVRFKAMKVALLMAESRIVKLQEA